MNAGDFTKIVIAAVMMIVIVMVVVIPVIQDAGSTEMTGHNVPSEYATAAIPAGVYAATETGYTIDGGAAHTLADREWVIQSDTVVIAKRNSSSFTVRDWTNSLNATVSSFTIAGSNYSYSSGGNTITHALGSNAITRSLTATDTGIYDDSFRVNKDDTIRMFVQTQNITISGSSYAANLILEGTADNLTIVKGMIATDPVNYNVTGTATLNDGYYGSPNDAVFEVASNPRIDMTLTIGGQQYDTYTVNSWMAVEPVAPIEYTELSPHDDAINGMIGIVPLLMIVGVVMMLVTAAVLRR